MENVTVFEYIDFDEEKAKLWQLAYSEIKRILVLRGMVNQRVELPGDGLIHNIKLELPDILIVEDNYGRNDYVEYFEDNYLFEVYKGLIQL